MRKKISVSIATLEELKRQEKWADLAAQSEYYCSSFASDYQGWFLLGKARLEQKSYKSAIDNLKKSLEIKETADAFFHLALAYQEMRSPLIAEEFFRKASKLEKKNIKFAIYRIVNLYNNKLYEEIKEITPEVIKHCEDNYIFPLVLMSAYENTDQLEAIPAEVLAACAGFAVDSEDVLIKCRYIKFLVSHDEFKELHRYKETLKQKNNNNLVAYANAKEQEKKGNINEAEKYYKEALSYNWEKQIVFSYTDLLYTTQRTKEAIDILKRTPSPHVDGEVLAKLASYYSLMENGIDKAIHLFKKALEFDPNARDVNWNYSLSLLQKGNLKEGWLKYQYREGQFLKRKFAAKKWDGKKSINNRKLMLWSEQGIGDYIDFASFLPDFIKTHKNKNPVIFETDPRLMYLFQNSFKELKIRKNPRLRKDMTPYLTDYDYHMPIGDLAITLRKNISDFDQDPYLKTDPDWDKEISKRLIEEAGSRKKVGIIWRSMNLSENRGRNYLSASELAYLFLKTSHLNIFWVNLQYGDCDKEIELIRNNFQVNLRTWDDIDLKDNFDAVASLIKNLDLVICPSTAVQSLSGAIGTRTWTFCPNPSWMLLGADNYPWHKTIRLYQANYPEPMVNVIPDITEDLINWFENGITPPLRGRVIASPEKKEMLKQQLPVPKKTFFSEEESEEVLAKGTSLITIKDRTASVILYKRINQILSTKKLKSKISIQPKPKLGGNIEDIKNDLCLQTVDELEFEIKTNISLGSKVVFIYFQDNVSAALPLNLVTPYIYPSFAWSNFFSDFNKIDNASFIQLRDSWQMWYQVGPLGSCLLNPEKAANKWLELMIPKIELSKAEKIICVGTSAGASAAIQFGAKLNADAVVAISPQARPLDGEWEIESGGFSFLEEGGDWRKQVRDKFNLSPLDLKPYADDLGDKLHIIIPKLNKTDITHADYLTQNNPNIQLYRSTGKNHADVNHELILDIIKKLI